MWPFSRRKSSLKATRKLAFKSGSAFFEYYCKFIDIPEIEVNIGCIGLVLDARKEFGTSIPVKIDTDGSQLAVLKIASSDGGFVLTSKTLAGKGDRLRPDDLVIWVPTLHAPSANEDINEEKIDPRFFWQGFIAAKIAPDIDLETGKPNILCRF